MRGRPGLRSRGLVRGLLPGLALLGCVAPGAPDAELSTAPIAIHYRTESEARLRADLWRERAEAEAGPSGPAVAGHKLGLRADLDALGSFLSRALGGEGEPVPEGRLALLDPRSRSLRFVEGARRGAVPLDWSPDRQRLLFSQPGPGGGPQVYEWERASAVLRRVTRGPQLHPQACYGREGRIAVTRLDAGGEEPRARVLLSAPGGRGPFAVIGAGPADHSPACDSASGDVVFARELPGGRSELWLRPEAGPARRLGPGGQPRFGSGGWIVYAAGSRGRLRLFRIRADGTGRAALGRGARRETWPALSPDGAHVVYVASEHPDRRHLYVRRFDGSGDRILFSDGDAEFPVW